MNHQFQRSLVLCLFVILLASLAGPGGVTGKTVSSLPGTPADDATHSPASLLLFEEINTNLPGVSVNSADWGDYDGDGDPDILLAGCGTPGTMLSCQGNYLARVYRNDGNGVFTNINAGLIGVWRAAAAWGDYDRDGDLDIVLTGNTGSADVAKIYRNNGNHTFTEINAGLQAVADSAVAWGDYDGDGDADLVLTGAQTAKVYRNNGNGTFTSISTLLGVSWGSAAWADFDRDADLDLLLTGWTYTAPSGPTTRIYRNTAGSFSYVSTGLTAVFENENSALAGDYDGDGDPDVLLAGCTTGYCNNLAPTTVFRNDGNNVFVNSGASLATAAVGSSDWGDYDSDGRPDIVLTGCSTYASSNCSSLVGKVYHNTASGFTEVATLQGIVQGTVTLGDYDRDGDLDILLSGHTGSGVVTKIYRNNSAPTTSSVSGRVTDNNNNPLGGVTISDGAGHTTTSDANGYYTLGGLPAGTYTVTVAKSGYTFAPPSRTVTVPPNATNQDFVGTATCAGGATAVDVLLVIDRSGSMFGQPLADEKVAAKGFVDRMNLTQDQVGLASFATTAALDHQLTHNGVAVKNAIDALVASGNTNMGDGINAAQAELQSARHNPAARPVMLLMSDGVPNVGPDPIAAAQTAKNAGTRIFTVGLGGVDENLMRQIASSPADYYYAPTSSDLQAIYQAIAGIVTCSPATIKVSPSTKRVPISAGNFTMDIVAQDITNLAAYQVELTYNPAIVHVVSVSPGPFLGSTGRTISPVGPIIDNNLGKVTFGAFTFGTQPGVNGTGVLATVTFQPRARGTSTLHLQNLQVADPASNLIPGVTTEDGQVEIVSCFGDFDGDNDVDIFDLQLASSHWNCTAGQPCYEVRFDTEPDGDIDVIDLQRFAAAWGTQCTINQNAWDETVERPKSENGSALQTPTAVRLSLLPTTADIALGSQFTLTVRIQDAVSIGAFQTDVIYDPNVLHVQGVSIGGFLGSTGRSVAPVGPVIDNTSGRVTFGAFTFGNQAGASGTGDLAYIRFMAHGLGQTTASFRQTSLSDTQGNVIYLGNLEDSSIRVLQQVTRWTFLPAVQRGP